MYKRLPMWHACNFNIYHVVGIYILFLFLFEPTVHLFQIMEKNLIVCTLYIDEMKIQWSIWPEFTVILHIYYTALPVGWDMFCSIEWFFVRKIMLLWAKWSILWKYWWWNNFNRNNYRGEIFIEWGTYIIVFHYSYRYVQQ